MSPSQNPFQDLAVWTDLGNVRSMPALHNPIIAQALFRELVEGVHVVALALILMRHYG